MFMLSRRRHVAGKLDLPVAQNSETSVIADGKIGASARSIRIALLLSAMLLCSVLFAHLPRPGVECPPEQRDWTVPASVPRYHGPSVEFPERYTLVLNSFKRHELLQRAIAHYSECSSIDAIRVIWCEDGLPPTRAAAPSFYSEAKEVRYDIMPNASLNHRFYPVEGLRTAAVLSIDDDIHAPCTQLDSAFQVWLEQERNLVGFYPRLHMRGPDCSYRYLLGLSTLAWHGAYSMVLTKAAFLHRDYLETYTNHMPQGIRDYVDSSRNCEDIAMALLVANMTAAAPTWVPPNRVIDLGQGLAKVRGISSASSHQKDRGRCLDAFAHIYGGLPLQVRNLNSHPHPWLLRLSPVFDRLYAISRGHI